MPHDPELLAETRAWLSKAAADLRAAQAMRELDPPLLEAAVFHCQQAAEKALKGFLTWHQVSFRKTHNLEEVGEQCLRLDPSLKAEIDRAAPLTEYAWKFRYPGDPGAPTSEEADEAIACACQVHAAVLSRLPGEARA
ncbi:MAG: HEPN domain-containing protein [Acidobacteria bacterium]|nr:HEPN domain-containing protein [Acidobacteriota bacterium]